MRIILAGPAKMGNVWVENILAVIYRLKILRPPQFPKGRDTAFKVFLGHEYEDQTIFHEHFPPTEEFLRPITAQRCHLVTVLRNPYDTFVSLYHYVQNYSEDFMEGNVPAKILIGKSIDHPDVLRYLEQGFRWPLTLANRWLHSGRSIIVRYEHLHTDPFTAVKRLTDPIQPVAEALIIEAIQASDAKVLRPEIPKHIRVATMGDWKNHLTAAHLRIFKSCHADLITSLGYEVLEEKDATRRARAEGAGLPRAHPGLPEEIGKVVPHSEQSI